MFGDYISGLTGSGHAARRPRDIIPKAITRRFTDIINGNRQFIIPVFQRDFSWTGEQCEQLWRDVGRASAGEANGGHFMGSVVYIGADLSSAFQSWLLIDGQQRLTTLTVLMIALRDHIRASGWSGGENSPTAAKIDAYYLKNTCELALAIAPDS